MRVPAVRRVEEVTGAGSGAEALRASMSARPDLVLLDVMMPDGDGFEVVRRMRSAGGPEVPVIFLTARDEVNDRLAGFEVGADDYVTKPFSLDEVLARIRAVLKRTRQAAGSRLQVADLVLDEDLHEVRRGGEIDRVDADGVPPAPVSDGQRGACGQ